MYDRLSQLGCGDSRVLTLPVGSSAGVGQDVDIFAGGPVACLADFGLVLGSVGGFLRCTARLAIRSASFNTPGEGSSMVG